MYIDELHHWYGYHKLLVQGEQDALDEAKQKQSVKCPKCGYKGGS